MPHSARAMKRQQCLTHRPVNKRGWVSQTRTRIFTGLVSLKRLLHFYVIRYLAYLYSANSTRLYQDLYPVLLSSANSCVDRRTSDDSIALRGKNFCFLIFNWFYGTLLIVLVPILKLDYSIKRFIL